MSFKLRFLKNLLYLGMDLKGLNRTQYSNHHHKLKRRFGKATKCENPSCTIVNPKQYHWAIKKGVSSYTLERNDYLELCASCHKKYDFKPEYCIRMSEARKGKCSHNKRRIVMMITEDDHFLYSSIANAVKETNISRSSINHSLSGRTNGLNGIKWRYRL